MALGFRTTMKKALKAAVLHKGLKAAVLHKGFEAAVLQKGLKAAVCSTVQCGCSIVKVCVKRLLIE